LKINEPGKKSVLLGLRAPQQHSTGFKLANDGQDTRAIQLYLGHRNIQHTVLYTQLATDRFNDFWKD
jgi:site-specific recombinase XerD